MTTHSKWIDRKHPGCFIFLVDQSDSMRQLWRGGGQAASPPSKADGVAHIVNRSLEWLVRRSGGDFEGLKHYFDVAVIGYGVKVGSVLPGNVSHLSLVDSPSLEKAGRSVTDGEVTRLVWIDAAAENGTPMAEALALAWRLGQGWATAHPDCFPPVVLNITDGQANDTSYGDPSAIAAHLREVATNDGALILFNINISGEQGDVIEYPAIVPNVNDEWAKMMFEMSSVLPDVMRLALPDGQNQPGARAFVMNADIDAALRALDIGTRRVPTLD